MKKIIVYLMLFFPLSSCNKKERIGAICNDGWKSSATGQGACSHHGGVDYWIYKK